MEYEYGEAALNAAPEACELQLALRLNGAACALNTNKPELALAQSEAALRLADLHEEAGSPKKAVKPLEAAFRNMPHEALATRLQALWGVNEGTAAARLMRPIQTR